MQITISATSIGGNAGPFAIYQNFDAYVTPVDTGITRTQILAGYVVTVNDATTTVRLISSGTCTNSTDISVIYPSPTPTVTPSITPTVTTTPSATPIITVNWFAELNCATATYSFSKNGDTIASGGGIVSDNGTFTCVVGDTLTANQTSGVKGVGCDTAQAAIERNGVQVAFDSQTGFNVGATATFTVTAGTTTINMYAGLIA
jgi:hypothetical protein